MYNSILLILKYTLVLHTFNTSETRMHLKVKDSFFFLFF